MISSIPTAPVTLASTLLSALFVPAAASGAPSRRAARFISRTSVTVPRWLGLNATTHARPREREVAHAVHRLVPHELVRPAQGPAHHLALVEHHRVLDRRALDEP